MNEAKGKPLGSMSDKELLTHIRERFKRIFSYKTLSVFEYPCGIPIHFFFKTGFYLLGAFNIIYIFERRAEEFFLVRAVRTPVCAIHSYFLLRKASGKFI